MSGPDDDRVALYLSELRDELANVEPAVRERTVRGIALRIADERSEGAGVEEILRGIGDPVGLAGDVRVLHGVRTRSRWREVAAIVLLPFGGVVIPIAGWFVGLYFLWSSPVWPMRTKLFATLCLPGGALGPLLLVGEHPLYALLLLGPLATCAWLTVSVARAQSR
jgi:hypothetical protein